MRILLAFLLLAAATVAPAAVETFDGGLGGWVGPTGSGGIGLTRETSGGNPGAHARVQFQDFGVYVSNATSPDFVGDLRSRGRLTVGADVKVDQIAFAGLDVTRELIVEFRSRALAQNGYPWSSVFVRLSTLNTGDPWARHSVTFDPASTALPPGWGGTGADNPVTFEPELPAGVTFADVMGSVDEVAYTTLVPGFFYSASDFDVRFDNLTLAPAAAAGIVPVPALGPAGLAMLAGLLALVVAQASRQRRRR